MKRTCFSTLKITILRSVWWMDIKIGKHLGIHISYKVLWLEFSYTFLNSFKFFIFSFSSRGAIFLAIFMKCNTSTLEFKVDSS